MPDKFSSLNWRELVYRAVETQDLDYKAAVNWNELTRVQKAKFARHAMAMANTRGGTIIIGVGEDPAGNPTQYTGLTEEQLRSFDPSAVGQTINNYADPSIDFDIVRPHVDGRDYAILVIRPFSELPHVCSDSCGDELQRGVFYMRTPDARSRSAYRASELHDLIQRALRNQRQLLGRMLRGILYEGRQYAEPDAEVEFEEQLAASQDACRQALGPKRSKKLPLLELVAYPPEFRTDAQSLSEVRQAVDSMIIPQLMAFDNPAAQTQRAYLTNDSFLSTPLSLDAARLFFWQLFQTGLIHHVSALSTLAASSYIRFPELVAHVAAAILTLGQYYTALGLEEELITFNVTVRNSRDCLLTDTPYPASGPLRCFIPEVVVVKRRTAADLASGPEQHALKVIHEICERFNLDASLHVGLRQRLHRLYQGHRGTPPPHPPTSP